MLQWIATYFTWLLVLAVAFVMVCRKLQREFPLFFIYLLTVSAADVARLMLFHYRLKLPYFYTYWITEAVGVLLAFLVLYEVFLIRLFPAFNTTKVYRWLFPTAGIIVVGLTMWLFFSAPFSGPSKLITFIGAATMALNFCQVTFLIFFAGLIWYMSHEWRRHELGIAGGFAFHASVKLIATGQWVANSYLPTKVDQLPRIGYLIAVVIWLFFLSKSDPIPAEVPITEEMAAEADRAYQDIVHLMRGKPRSRG